MLESSQMDLSLITKAVDDELNKSMNVDEINKVIGDFRTGQIIQLFLLCWPFMLAGYLSVDIVFLMAVPDFVCRPDNQTMEALMKNFNATEPQLTEILVKALKSTKDYKQQRCLQWSNSSELFDILLSNFSISSFNFSTDVQCNNFMFSTETFTETIPKEMNLVCNTAYAVTLLKTIFFVGRIVGAVIFGALSDIIGRLPTFIIVVVFNIISSVGLGVCANAILVGVFLFVQGLAQVGYSSTVFVLGLEMVGKTKRNLASNILQIFYTVAFIIIPLLYLRLQSWRLLALIPTAPAFLFVLYYKFVYESPRWLYATKKMDHLVKVLRVIAKRNGVKNKRKKIEEIKINLYKQCPLSNENVKCCDCSGFRKVKNARKVVTTLIRCCIIWMAVILIYYGIIYNSENLGGNIYLNFALMGIVEIPAYIIVFVTIDRIGRKKPLIIFLILAAVSCVIAGSVPKEQNVVIILFALLGKLCISVSYAIVYLFVPETFETTIRNTAYGIANMFGRVGGAIVPPLLTLSNYFLPLPMLIFAASAAVASAIAYTLDETKDKDLDNTCHDIAPINGETTKMLSSENGKVQTDSV